MQLYNVILIYLIVGVFVNYIFKVNFSILSCGIFAWVGKDVKYFRRDLFNILGMYNDSRGGDACGIYYDENWYKGIGKTSKYEKLIIEHDLHNTLKLKKNPLIIGHDRKTSVGTTTLDNAQPVVLVNYDSEELSFVQAHNGTITNYRELAKKYEMELMTGESDSVAIAKLVDTFGWDVLGEYEGSGAFVMCKATEPNVLYAFHGKSKATEYAVTAVDERPLAFLNFPGKGTYISSDIDHLHSISIPSKEIVPHEFKYNILYKLEGDSIEEFKVIDRTLLKIKPKTSPVTTAYTGKVTSFKSPFGHEEGIVRTAIRYYNGLYRIEGKPAHGTYVVDNWGYPIMSVVKFNKEKHYELSFIFGILMRSRINFEAMYKIVKNEKILDADEFYETINWSKINAVIELKKHALSPFWRYDEKSNFTGFIKPDVWTNHYKYAGYYYFDGLYKPLFSKIDFKLYSGDINTVTENSYMFTITDFMGRGDISDKDYDFSETSVTDLLEIRAKLSGKTIALPAPVVETKIGCDKCDAWRSNPALCETCISDDEVETSMDKAYSDYEKHMGSTVMFESFKAINDAIDDSIDTYDSLSIDLKDQDIEELLDDFRKLQSKINKY